MVDELHRPAGRLRKSERVKNACVFSVGKAPRHKAVWTRRFRSRKRLEVGSGLSTGTSCLTSEQSADRGRGQRTRGGTWRDPLANSRRTAGISLSASDGINIDRFVSSRSVSRRPEISLKNGLEIRDPKLKGAFLKRILLKLCTGQARNSYFIY